jgi:hypothetical protein
MLALPAASSAGTLCGTVRDGQTSAPLAGALVLSFLTNGSFAGYSAVTAGDGTFCLESIPAGTYDLQVRVRDHLVGTAKNVVVTDDVTGVAIDGTLPAITLGVFPNPARSQARIEFAADDAAWATVAVFDARGRFLRGWSAHAPLDAERALVWDLRDAEGRDVPAGLYFIRLTTDSGSMVRRLARLH